MRRGDWSRLHADNGARKAALRPWSNVLAVGHRRRAGAPPKTPRLFLPHPSPLHQYQYASCPRQAQGRGCRRQEQDAHRILLVRVLFVCESWPTCRDEWFLLPTAVYLLLLQQIIFTSNAWCRVRDE